ncbi:Probable ATP-dependent RNA helicase DDX52 [Strongyloides ratti]|uniref:ATP-dependent RNA helicase n=1 Tax=Strongyloides ratti TaxID=34506 RepID=A0A090LCA9_STRRB|nr:Probable ATP-dependent RNA helicase DDX52 [Strongyloides ratti]CEF67436.1 Probable ATP-dependent RNA helicase DDX52 [Strongyloides ratti]
MSDNTKFSDIIKSLTFGVKRKRNIQDEKKDGNELRMRIIPETNYETKKVKIEEESDSSDGEGVMIFSDGNPKKKDSDVEKNQEILEDDRINELRRVNKIFTWGTDIPPPFINFCDLNLPEQFMKNLETFKIKEPSPIQMQAIPIMLKNREIMASAPTGSGKTLSFIIPIMLNILNGRVNDKKSQHIKALIIQPTKILAKQTYLNFIKFTNGLDIKIQNLEDEVILEDTKVLITTPNRFIYTMKNYKKKILKHLEWLVVDESDRLFETTEKEKDGDFRSQLAEIYNLCDGLSVKHAFFSATFSGSVENWCKENLNDVVHVCIGMKNSSNTNVDQELVFAGTEQGKISTMKDMLRRGFHPPAIVFVQSKHRAKQLYLELKETFKNMNVALLTSKVSDKDKDFIIEKFRLGSIYILVCTELLGRGLDVAGVNLVVNYDLPTSIISYIHRVGRTGRAGKTGKAITYFTEDDIERIRPIATVIHQAGYQVPEYTLKMKKLSRRTITSLKKKAPKRKDIRHLRNDKNKKTKTKPKPKSE